MRFRFAAAAGLVALFLAPHGKTPALPSFPSAAAGAAGEIVAGEVLVKFRPSASLRSRRASVAALGHAYLAALDPSGWVHVKTAPGQTVAEALAAYRGDPSVEAAQPNFVYRASAVPADPGYALLWGLRNIGQDVSGAPTQPASTPIGYATHNPGTPGADMSMEKAWDRITDCSSVIVAVLDTGINYTHEDLAANMWNGGTSYPK
ncbi:MAG TPA: hypothetical protein VIW03_04090, partial [Anaeromyxobacter sp.]